MSQKTCITLIRKSKGLTQEKLAELSKSLKGHPYDNGRMEAFHSILKREEVYLKAYQTLTEVQAAIGWYINFYNRNRISNVA